jgi:NAD(P)-dependent dehydrogenase (short-subunit alcohol dehydrogenase family)
MELFNVKGRVVAITGGTGVLGRAMVEYFAAAGARVVILARNAGAGRELAERTGARFVSADVLNRESLEAAAEAIGEPVDVLINCAGGNQAGATVPPDKTVFDLDIDAMRAVVDLNLFGTVLPTLVFGRAMADRGRGSMINIASESALRPLTRVAGYGVAKAAVVNLTKYLAGEMAMKFGEGIRVNAVAPGFFLSEQNRTLLTNPDGSLTARGETIVGHTPFRRFGRPEELLGTLHYLASDASAFVTGTLLVVDGGFDAFSI